MLTKLKEKVQATLAAEAKAAHEIGLTPNQISLIGIALAFLSALAYAEWHINKLYLLLAAVLLLFSGFCDILDGALARLYHKTTPFGGFLDSLLDRYADAFVYIGIILSGLCDTLWGLIALTGSLLVSYSRARAEAAEIKMESIGLAERAERIIILAIASITAFFWKLETDLFWQPINIGVIVLAILSNLTVLQRSVYAYKKLKKQGN
jgi:archaetidylinositol phosphate synthase